jgi:hypothetical protein
MRTASGSLMLVGLPVVIVTGILLVNVLKKTSLDLFFRPSALLKLIIKHTPLSCRQSPELILHLQIAIFQPCPPAKWSIRMLFYINRTEKSNYIVKSSLGKLKKTRSFLFTNRTILMEQKTTNFVRLFL